MHLNIDDTLIPDLVGFNQKHKDWSSVARDFPDAVVNRKRAYYGIATRLCKDFSEATYGWLKSADGLKDLAHFCEKAFDVDEQLAGGSPTKRANYMRRTCIDIGQLLNSGYGRDGFFLTFTKDKKACVRYGNLADIRTEFEAKRGEQRNQAVSGASSTRPLLSSAVPVAPVDDSAEKVVDPYDEYYDQPVSVAEAKRAADNLIWEQFR
jgi:hypothetical protein